MSVPLTLAPVPAPSPSSTTATPVSPITSPSDTTAGMNSPTTTHSTTPSNSASNVSTTSNSNNNNNTHSESSTAPSKRKASRRANTAERRATHNAVERQRRETLNGRFLDLAALLPNLATVRRPSKSAIVNSSIALIHSHRRARAAAGRELRALEEETQALRREVNEWRARTGAIPPLQAPQRSPEFMALLHAGDADDEGAAAEEERRAYLLAGQGDDDDEDWDANTGPATQQQQQQQQQHQVQAQHTQPVGPASYNVPMMASAAAAGPGMMDEKMAHYAFQYAMQMQGMHHGHAMSVGPDPRMAMAALQAQQRSEHPQWSATAAPHTPTTPSPAAGPTLFARPVPIPQASHGHGHGPFSGPFAFGVPPLNTNTPNTFNTAGFLGTSPGTGSNGGGGFVVGSPTGSTPPATTSSSFEDAGTESEGEQHGHGMGGMSMGGMGAMNGMGGKWMQQQQQAVRTGGPGGFAAMGMGVVI